jgi:hypothetical protein
MSVEQSSQLLFPWKRCRDGYEIREDEEGAPWFHPLSANSEEIEPLEDTALFRRFADLDAADPEAILGFIKHNGLDSDALEPDPLGLWQVAIGSMRDGVNAWLRGDVDSLAVTFNELNMGAVHLRLAPRPWHSPPILYIEPSSLFLALWAQLAHAASHSLTQRQCDFCRRWYSPQTKRSKFCDTPCRTANKYYQDKEQGK